jgi:hypothetical protein
MKSMNAPMARRTEISPNSDRSARSWIGVFGVPSALISPGAAADSDIAKPHFCLQLPPTRSILTQRRSLPHLSRVALPVR